MKKFIVLFVICILFLGFVIGKHNDIDEECVTSDNYTQSVVEQPIESIGHTHEKKKLTGQKSEVDSNSIDEIAFAIAPSSLQSQRLRHKAYTVSYNKNTRCPNWVAWHLTAEHTDGPYGRLGNFHEEEDVPTPRATLDDYRGSGWSRGHMCPAGDNKWDETAMFESFSLVNVCPQNASLNSGLWNSIEMDCRKWARRYGDIYIVCGPVFYNREHEVIGYNEVYVPEAFFKVVLCLNGKPKAMGFVVKNTDGNKKRDLYYNSIDQVERITGMDFFPALPDDIEKQVEAEVNMKEWR